MILEFGSRGHCRPFASSESQYDDLCPSMSCYDAQSVFGSCRRPPGLYLCLELFAIALLCEHPSGPPCGSCVSPLLSLWVTRRRSRETSLTPFEKLEEIWAPAVDSARALVGIGIGFRLSGRSFCSPSLPRHHASSWHGTHFDLLLL